MEPCSSGDPVGDFFKGFFDFLFNPIGTIIELIAKAILAGAIEVFASLTYQIPTLTGTETPRSVSSQTQWIVVYLAVGSLLFAAVRMAVERRSTAGITALKGILRVIVVSAAATTVVAAAATIADNYSAYLFEQGAKTLLYDVGACSDGSGFGSSFLLLILAFLLLIAGIIQTILMYIRLGVMIVLLGTLPVAAAASMTDWGSGWWRKHIGWLIAWLLYKPAAGLVMYAGAAMITNSHTVKLGEHANRLVSERIAGIGVLLVSAVALPALLKLVVPATAALGGASAYSGAMQSVGGALATGARSLGGSGSGSGAGSGSQGRPGPSGASGSPGGAGSSGASGANGSAGASGGGGRTGPGGAAGGSTGGGSGGGAGERAGAGAGAAGGAGRAAAAAGGPSRGAGG
ncbi:hypothetical protein, partial [Streptomyces mexicanus]|uniref:hypothetical protein n=1 Tax=Streptomyces mexicanus TaxID=178566 RepID=UPI00364D109A